MTTLYGIPNCDSCKKARKWLKEKNIEHQFHDIRNDGLRQNLVAHWLKSSSAKVLVNTRSTTWRGLDEAQREMAGTSEVTELLLAHPTLIKRPVLDTGEEVLVGFNAEDYAELLAG